jgi:hypothetical protein
MNRSAPLLMFFSAPRIAFSALGVAAAAVFLLGSTSPTEHPNIATPVFSFDAQGAGTTPNALQGTAAFGINASGEIVGIVTDSNGVHHGILRGTDGNITKFDAPNAGTSGNQGTLAAGINTAGDVTGYYTDSQQAQHGFIRTANGTLTPFDVPSALTTGYNKGTNAIGINDKGDVVGQFASGIAYQNGPFVHGFLRTSGGAYTTFDAPNAGDQPNTGTTAVAINATGVIAGYSGDPKDIFHGFIRAVDGTLTQFDAPGAGTGHYQGTISTAINVSGVIAGVYLDSSSAAHGFLRSSSGSITTFDAPGAGTGMLQGTFPLGINSSGEIVGFDFDAKYLIHAFTRAPTNGTLTTIDALGAGTAAGTSGNQDSFQGTGAFGINDAGQITGTYLDSSSVAHGFLANPAMLAPPSFQISATAVSLSRGATSGNTSTVTVTPGNFTGPVALTAAITTSPAGAQDPPTLSFGATTPVTITGTSAGTATLTIGTTAASSASLAHPNRRQLRLYGAGSAVLACILFFGFPARRRGWMRLLSLLLLFAASAGVILGCSGSGGSTSTGPSNSGTTPGSYVVTVTGTSGATTATGTVALTVQ